ncbi:hypothetical protein [Paenibacillus pini]|uniref:Uncharacterized protein n=1 Tax=Paenibacillus pini JCM 16418 TaxID=1236976 RepID=W7Y9C9_9BACL|nr:hypothetical protein [Paenibacillus pini]GAF07585.1 hypothetical protein JCM16418_1612 [Paenibacillus pini JCM 16418]
MDEVQTEMLQRITRVETVVDGMNKKLDSAINAKDLAVEALTIARDNTRRISDMEDGQKFMRRAIGGSAITLVMGIIIAAIKLGVV